MEDGKKRRPEAILERIPEDKEFHGAEIGLWRGATCSKILKQRPLLKMIGVDRYCPPPPGDSYFDGSKKIANYGQEEFDMAKKKAFMNLEPVMDRFQLIEMTSVEASDQVPNGSLDFVFIDGDHSYIGCMADIIAWLPKVKPGGWIGGHDYAHPEQGNVKGAVDEAFKDKEIVLSYQRTWFVQL